eukprot:CAMPEP_0114519090 /NCGR_PEP_ID=MMETSP0109-20121206/18808_1 /TAXON_ID=29199 /ORGANISM="Chlorarachnion reptans, Strain CCCM449" /LENGTH=163 /DNA_ID=CAMNT_0001699787 /DNA_START=43 /DNA_END=534 /DNA_ORIENTATION=-
MVASRVAAGACALLALLALVLSFRDSSNARDLELAYSRTGMKSYRPSMRTIRRPLQMRAKKDFHPDFHEDVPVFCNGDEVYKTSGTSDRYVVDIWSGNHPFYQGTGTMVVKADRIDKFKGKYDGMDDLFGADTDLSGIDGVALKKAAMESLGIKKEKGKKGRR